jgi:IclR family pca regulon transcriptional regulator
MVGESSQPLTLTEVANSMELTKTSSQRFLQTLCSLGYLQRDHNKKYTLDMKVLSLGFSFLNGSNLTKLAKPYVEELSSELNKTVNLVVLDNLEIVYLYRKEVRSFLKYDLHAGSRLPAYCTAAGKVLLAGLADEELIKRMGLLDLEPLTPRTITSKDALWDDIIKTRERGYSICDRELSMDLYSLAVSLINAEKEVVAAINVTMDAREEEIRTRKRVLRKLIHKGSRISELLGYRGNYPEFWS